jgi:hypothetical protein
MTYNVRQDARHYVHDIVTGKKPVSVVLPDTGIAVKKIIDVGMAPGSPTAAGPAPPPQPCLFY